MKRFAAGRLEASLSQPPDQLDFSFCPVPPRATLAGAAQRQEWQSVTAIYRFENCLLDAQRRELWRSGKPVAVEPQVFDLLEYLVRNRDRVVTKDEIFTSIWGGRIVSESTLTSRINSARSAIGDDGKTQRLIRTLRHKGIRFVGEASEGDGRGAKGSRTRVRRSLALPDNPSIAVLPFANLSGDPAQDYFADGMVEEITMALGRLPWLFVIASASAFTYKGRAVDVRQAGIELGVRYLLQGSVRKENDRVRIAVHLTDAAQGRQILSERFDCELQDDLFAAGSGGDAAQRADRPYVAHEGGREGAAQADDQPDRLRPFPPCHSAAARQSRAERGVVAAALSGDRARSRLQHGLWPCRVVP